MKKRTKKERITSLAKHTKDLELAKALVEMYDSYEKHGLKHMYLLSKSIYKKWPDNLWAIKTYAALHGDWGEMLHTQKEKKYKAEAVKILGSFVHKLKGVSPILNFRIRNEYYYHSGQFYKQYRLGIEYMRTLKEKYSYSVAVGASEYGYELFKKGQVKRAQNYGKISIWHWEQLNQTKGINFFYYQALALSGKTDLALKAFEKDAKIDKHFNEKKRCFQKYKKRMLSIKQRPLSS